MEAFKFKNLKVRAKIGSEKIFNRRNLPEKLNDKN